MKAAVELTLRIAPLRRDNHARDHPGAQIDHGLDVDAHHLELAVDVGRRDRAHRAEPSVVDEDVDLQAAPLDLGEELDALLGDAEVTRDHLDAGVQLLGQCVERILATSDEGDAVPAL